METTAWFLLIKLDPILSLSTKHTHTHLSVVKKFSLPIKWHSFLISAKYISRRVATTTLHSPKITLFNFLFVWEMYFNFGLCISMNLRLLILNIAFTSVFEPNGQNIIAISHQSRQLSQHNKHGLIVDIPTPKKKKNFKISKIRNKFIFSPSYAFFYLSLSLFLLLSFNLEGEVWHVCISSIASSQEIHNTAAKHRKWTLNK